MGRLVHVIVRADDFLPRCGCIVVACALAALPAPAAVDRPLLGMMSAVLFGLLIVAPALAKFFISPGPT